MDRLVLDTDWESLISQVAGHGIGIRLVWGSNDTIGDQALGHVLAAGHPSIEVELTASPRGALQR